MGTLLEFTDDLGTPQIVRYEKGQKFDLHHDWYDSPQMLKDGTRRWFNRLGSFFVYLEAKDVEEGETWFPYLKYKYDGLGVKDGHGEKWISGGEGGGVKFVPRKGSAIFWMNLHRNGTGDERVMHAGLPLKAGRKTAMNIWPRQFVQIK